MDLIYKIDKPKEKIKLKIKVSTLKHCIQKILKIDTTGMSVETMKEILLNTLEEKKEEKKPIYIANYITSDEESQLLSYIKKATKWNTSLERRTLHMGYEYDYTRKNTLIEAEPIPDWLEWLRQRVSESFGMNFDQVLINEYIPGQGISKHIDNMVLFENVVVSITLGSQCTMVFEKVKSDKKIDILLERRSAVVLSGKFRDKWTHMIPARKSDKVDGKTVKRDIRLSITFRKIKDGISIEKNKNR